MEVIAKIILDSKQIQKFERYAKAATGGNVDFMDVARDNIEHIFSQFDKYVIVDVRAGN